MSDLVKSDIEDRRVRRSKMRSMIAFLPNLLKLLYRMMLDARVSRADKAVLAATILYVIAPLDFLPDFIPFIGQVDDVYLVAIALLRFINRADEDVVTNHWDGKVNIKSLVLTISNLAHFFLPARLRNVLVGNLEKTKESSRFKSFAGRQSEQQGD